MASIITLPTLSDNRGSLTVIEKILPFQIKRVYYIYDTHKNILRGGHRHKEATQAIICLSGECEIFYKNNLEEKTICLTSPTECMVLQPEDWHTMKPNLDKSILLILSSHEYDASDYVYEEYK
ncbi:MAG: hypothetical protein A2381_01080 [Bdellovibrionales bacterium RIFOXYB1_FULL_37_110]|nr:MAG: hypothetical protein A2417_01935 [Bdellovibrionales bacterium RIFOXYC1_FULL_37_79]OFZ58811.1 MAG: hypothetical protein A2381_01080 [Bdellovibrionales bacterium RIFOXYB1_FULL_37_110]OFZ64810.1 MAG: hypothetical protein A2577_07080 [Bdellovibrionales bacterium RIFOXYD1_FULL_36_51]